MNNTTIKILKNRKDQKPRNKIEEGAIQQLTIETTTEGQIEDHIFTFRPIYVAKEARICAS